MQEQRPRAGTTHCKVITKGLHGASYAVRHDLGKHHTPRVRLEGTLNVDFEAGAPRKS